MSILYPPDACDSYKNGEEYKMSKSIIIHIRPERHVPCERREEDAEENDTDDLHFEVLAIDIARATSVAS